MKRRGPERAVIFIFGGAFVLSLFIGLVSKKPFGIALGRAFIASILFGAILAGGLLLLRRYIPDLGSMIDLDRQREEPETQDAETGRVVDYTVGEGVAGGAQGVEAYAGQGFPVAAQGEVGADIGELGGFSPAADLVGRRGTSAGGERAQGTGADPQAPARSAKPAEAVVRNAGPEEGDGIGEALPSLDMLFESEEEAAGSDDERSPEVVREGGKQARGKGDYINIREARIPNEPAVMAKAIKRIMKQD